jgi:NMD protein affecting ribosome stability and mRNA decay
MEIPQHDCPKCLGVGEILPRDEHFGVMKCPHCGGKRKVDWVEAVMGKRQNITVAELYKFLKEEWEKRNEDVSFIFEPDNIITLRSKTQK